MKLTRDEQSSLYELTISTGRADASTARLVQLGLVEAGTGKFGNWVKITAKGRALANTFTREEQLAFLSMSAASGGHADPPPSPGFARKKTQPAPSTGGPIAQATAKVSLPPETPARSAPVRRETKQRAVAPSTSPRSPYLKKLHANRS